MRIVHASVGLALVLALAAGCGSDDSDGEAASVEGQPWVLTSGVDLPRDVAVGKPSASFADGTMGGSTGCNRYTTSYTVDGDSLELGQIATTRMACAPPADAIERAYVAALAQVAGWRIEGEELVLVDGDDNEVLRFEAATPVGSWEVTGFLSGDAVTSPLAGTTVTATFSESGPNRRVRRLQHVHELVHDGRRRDQDHSARGHAEGVPLPGGGDGAGSGVSRSAAGRGELPGRRQLAPAPQPRWNDGGDVRARSFVTSR